jgi:hypothetical protein
MLWLFVFLIWAIREAIGGHAAGRPAMNAILCLLAILGTAQAILSVNGLIEDITALLSG